MTSMPVQTEKKWVYLDWLTILFIGIIVRFTLLPFATTDNADTVTRVWMAWKWLSHPQLITHGVWGPLHFYLIALALKIYHDPIFAPVALNIIMASVTPIFLYHFMIKEFNAGRLVSLIVSVMYSLYPITINSSLAVKSEVPFLFFAVLCLLFLARANQEQGDYKDAFCAGICLTLAGMLRYEGWMLIPLLSITLWKKPKLMLTFIMSAVIHPIFWMIGNWCYYGDPIYSINAASSHEINIEGRNENLTILIIIQRILFFPFTTFWEMTPVAAFLCLFGITMAAIKRSSCLKWLIAPTVVLILLTFNAAKGSLVLKTEYTATLGTLFFPFISNGYSFFKDRNYSKNVQLMIFGSVFLSMLFFLIPTISNKNISIGGVHLPGIDAIPNIPDKKDVNIASPRVNCYLKQYKNGFICDFFGWANSYYLASMTRLNPTDIFMAPGGKYENVKYEKFLPFVASHSSGVILLVDGSRFEHLIQSASDLNTTHNLKLSLQKLESLSINGNKVTLYRYQAS